MPVLNRMAARADNRGGKAGPEWANQSKEERAMKKNLGAAGELFPQSVFIVASYGEDGTPNAMNVA